MRETVSAGPLEAGAALEQWDMIPKAHNWETNIKGKTASVRELVEVISVEEVGLVLEQAVTKSVDWLSGLTREISTVSTDPCTVYAFSTYKKDTIHSCNRKSRKEE